MMDLSINEEKKKVMLFNKSGIVLNENPEHTFHCGDTLVSQYIYLSTIIKPSSSFDSAVNELNTKNSQFQTFLIKIRKCLLLKP